MKIVPFLVNLFNSCIDNGTFINKWKQAIVTPLHKKGSLNDMNNYRGISVLPPISKLFETVLANQIKFYFNENKLFSIDQHGFRAAHSCETALHEIISKCLGNLDDKLINALLLVDFKKAFDMIDRELMLYKLGNCGFDKLSIQLLSDYFKNRTQVVKIDEIQSQVTELLMGIIQGSCLGPLLFIIFINDLPSFLKNLKAKLFADDTTIIFIGNSLEELN